MKYLPIIGGILAVVFLAAYLYLIVFPAIIWIGGKYQPSIYTQGE